MHPSNNYGLSGQTPHPAYDPFFEKPLRGIINVFNGKYRKQANEMEFKEREAQVMDTASVANLNNAIAASLVRGDTPTNGIRTSDVLMVSGAGVGLILLFLWIRKRQAGGTNKAMGTVQA